MSNKFIYYLNHFRKKIYNNANETSLLQVYLLLKNGYGHKEIKELLPSHAMSTEEILNHPYAYKYKFLYHTIGIIQFLDFILKQNKYKKRIKNILLKNLTYPLVLLGISLLMSYFFIYILIPQILNSLSEFQIGNEINLFIHMLSIIHLFLFLLVGMFFFFWLLTRNKKMQILIYSSCYRKFTKNIIIDRLSLDYAHVLLLLYQSGLPIQECIKIIHALKEQYIISIISYHIKTELEEGKALKNVITKSKLTEELKAYLLVAIESGDFKNVLQDYVTFKEEIFEKNITKIAKMLQMGAYSYISLLLVIMYQVVFLPMQMLNQI